MLRATLNEAIAVQMLASDGDTSLFGRFRVYDSGGTLKTTINLPHLAEGLYGAEWTPDTEGHYGAVYELFFDSGRTNSAIDLFPKQGESIEVSSDKTNITRLLGLVHDNAVLDQTNYNSDGRLVSARLRIYDTKTNAQAAGATGKLFEYAIATVFVAGLVNTYTMTREL